MAFGDVYTAKSKLSFGTGSYARSGDSLTLNQTIAMMVADQREKDRSFLGKVFSGGKGGVVFGLRQIMRPSLAVTTGLVSGLEGKGAFNLGEALHGAKQGFQLEDIKTGSNVLTELGWAKGGKLKSVAGFGVDVLTDPTLPLQIGATILSGGSAGPAIIAGRAALSGFAKAGASASAKKLAADAAIKTLKEAGEGFSQRKALAMAEKNAIEVVERGGELTEAQSMKLAFQQTMAKTEQDLSTKKAFQLAYNIPFSHGKRIPLTPTTIGGKRVAPLTPSLNRTAEGVGLTAKIPGMSKVAMGVGKTFRHGFNEEEWQKPLLAVAHAGQKLNDNYINAAHEFLGPHRNLPLEAQQYALDTAAGMVGLVKRGQNGVGHLNERRLNEMVDSTKLTKPEADFVKDWHNYWEYVAKKDKEYGVKYDKQLGDRIYVPHIYRRDGGAIKASELTAASPGFIKERVGNLTLKEMEQLSKTKEGIAGGWVSKPFDLVAIRSRRGAQAQAAQMLLSTMRRSVGVPSRVTNPARIAKLKGMLDKAEKKYADNAWSVEGPKYGAKKGAITKRANKALTAGRTAIEHEFAPQYAAIKAAFNTDKITEKTVISEVKKLNVAEAKQLKKLEEKVLHKQTQEFEALDVARDKANQVLVDENIRTQRIQKILDANPKMKNPHIPVGWVEVSKKIDSEFHYFPPNLAKSMNRVEAGYLDDEVQAKLVGAWGRAMAAWKIGVTSVNPGYRIRNTLSDVWNMYISGVPAWAIPVYAKQAHSIQKRSRALELKMNKARVAGTKSELRLTSAERKDLRMMMEMHTHGILSGLFGGDVQHVSRLLARGVSATDALKDGEVLRAYVRMTGNINRRWEDKGRITHYLYRRQYERMGASDSADWVKKAHFDYTELSKIEQEKFKKILPFYTWTRKNMPYQLAQMISRPGKFATFPKAVNTANEMATEQDGPMAQPGLLPEWQGDNMNFRIPSFDIPGLGKSGDNFVVGPMIGVTDLNKFEGVKGFKKFIGMEAPWIKAPIEIATGKSLFTGQDLDTGGRSPVSGATAAILGAIPGNPLDTGETSRNVKGERVAGVGANPWFSYAAGQIPMTNFLVNQMSSIKRQQRGGTVLPVIGYVGGVPIYDRDLEAEVAAASIENRDKVAEIIRNLRREGKVPPAEKKKLSAFEQMLQDKLKGG